MRMMFRGRSSEIIIGFQGLKPVYRLFAGPFWRLCITPSAIEIESLKSQTFLRSVILVGKLLNIQLPMMKKSL